MALVTYTAGFAPPLGAGRLFDALIARTRRNVRATTAVSVLVICGCFATATVLQMQRAYTHATELAGAYTSAQAEVLAGETARVLDRLASLGMTYIDVADAFSATYVVEASEGDRVLNIALTDAQGRFVTAMKGEAIAAAPLTADVMRRLDSGPLVVPFSDAAIGSSPFTLIFRAGNTQPTRAIVMPLNPAALMPQGALGESALATHDGVALALGEGWEVLPPQHLLQTLSSARLREVKIGAHRRIVALARLDGWPLAAVASVRSSDALAGWNQSLPLYLFVLLGPAIAGALLAILLVREFERADRARTALVNVKAMATGRG